MKIISTKLKEVKIIEYDSKSDNRGYSYCIFCKEDLEQAEINFDYIEERVYFSEKAGTLYGIHFQNNPRPRQNFCIVSKAEVLIMQLIYVRVLLRIYSGLEWN